MVQVVETIEMQTMGSLMAAKQLWEQAIVPSLLSGAGTWVDISPESEALCEDLQEEFWRVMMQVSKSSPKVMLTAETSSIRMKERIWQMKLLTARNIMRNKESLAYQIYREQVDMSWPGLAREVEEICQKIGLKNLNDEDSSKEEIKEAIFFRNYLDMKEDMEKYKKLEAIKNEDFREAQQYMEFKSIDQARMAYRIRCKMVKSIKDNFKNSYSDLACDNCQDGSLDSQSHAVMCPGWEEQRQGLELTNIKDMVVFFTRILKEKGKQ